MVQGGKRPLHEDFLPGSAPLQCVSVVVGGDTPFVGCATMFHPSRGGVRGGRDQFNWENVKSDKDRDFYLGHSLMVRSTRAARVAKPAVLTRSSPTLPPWRI